MLFHVLSSIDEPGCCGGKELNRNQGTWAFVLAQMPAVTLGESVWIYFLTCKMSNIKV